MKQNLMNAFSQAGLILFISVLAGLSTNLIRSDAIPFVQDWSASGRLSAAAGDSMMISLEEAKALFDQNKAVFLDARGKDLFDQGHIRGAVSLPWHEVDDYFPEVSKWLDRSMPVITYCDGESCNLSHELAIFLKHMGFSKVKVLVNGWTVWQENTLPVETSQ